MQQAKAARAAGLTASAQSGISAPSMGSVSGSSLTMSGQAQSEEPTPKKGRQRAKVQSGNKPKKGQSTAASTQANAEKKTVGKPGRPLGRATAQPQAKRQSAQQEDAISLLTRDHRTVEQLFKSFEDAEAASAKEDLVQQICMELIIHTHLEEQIFYAACRENGVEDDALDEAQVEHDGAKVMIADLLEASAEDTYFDAKVKVLKEYIRHHVNEEEKSDGIFSKARQASLDLDEIGAEMKALKEELTAEGDAVAAAPLEAPSLQLNNINTQSEETQMPRQSRYEGDDDYRSSRGRSSGNRMRDEEGRFMSDDDDDGRSSRRSMRSSYDDDDDDRSRRSSRGRQDMERDEQGRFMSDDDDDRSSRSRSSRSSYDDDDDRGRSRGGRSQGGWFGDSEGHAEAAREGWRSRGRDDDDDDRGGRSRGRSSGGGRAHGRGGWFGDSEGHSQARQQSQSSRYDDDDDDDRGGRSRSRSQGGRSQGGRSRSSQSQGGWFGDSRGHAEAARRGWRDRD